MESRIINLDVLPGLASLPADTFHCAMTSPPYWRLRSYPGIAPTQWADGQLVCLGAEADPESFIRHLVEVFAGVRRVLREDGVLFVNIGETYAATGGGGASPGETASVGNTIDGAVGDRAPRVPPAGLKPGDRCGIPERFALAMQADGWYWRDTIIWAKRSPMPSSQFGWRWVRCRVKLAKGTSEETRGDEINGFRKDTGRSCTDMAALGMLAKWADCPGCPKCSATNGLVLRKGRFRTTAAHEPIFVFAKGERYFMDDRAAAETAVGGTPGNRTHKYAEAYAAGDEKMRTKAHLSRMDAVESRNPRSWWPLSAEPLKEKHFAAFPTALVKKCLEMATSKAGCCAACGSPYAPIVESSRVPTRPGENAKVGRREAMIESGADPVKPFDPNIVGNRDPQRHIAVTRAVGYLPTCKCGRESVPCLVLDPFGGSGTTGQVATAMGLDWVLVEGSAEYVEIAKRRVTMPLRKAKGPKKRRERPASNQRRLFA